MTQTKTADSKGRVTLGERFANRTVILEEIDETEVRVTLARVIPEREAWLYENKKALASVRRGIRQAAAGQFSRNPPDIEADAKLADELEGNA